MSVFLQRLYASNLNKDKDSLEWRLRKTKLHDKFFLQPYMDRIMGVWTSLFLSCPCVDCRIHLLLKWRAHYFDNKEISFLIILLVWVRLVLTTSLLDHKLREEQEDYLVIHWIVAQSFRISLFFIWPMLNYAYINFGLHSGLVNQDLQCKGD